MDDDPIEAIVWQWERVAVQTRSENDRLKSQLAHASMHLDALQATVREQSLEVARLAGLLEHERREVSALKATASWRITAPLRSLKRRQARRAGR